MLFFRKKKYRAGDAVSQHRSHEGSPLDGMFISLFRRHVFRRYVVTFPMLILEFPVDTKTIKYTVSTI